MKTREADPAPTTARVGEMRRSRVWITAGLRFIATILLLCLTLFVVAGAFDWLMGWVYVGLTVVSTLVSRLWAARVHPDLLAERASYTEKTDAKPWDRKLVLWIAVILPLATQVVAGLNYRFGWPPALPLWLALIGLALVVVGWALGTWAMVANRFFSAVVRIQTDRGHTVVDRGPYRWVRHPAYTGGVLANLGVPLMLGSAWALIPGALTVALLVRRTALEDRTLQAELPGYAGYAARTRHRLLPGVW